MKTLLVSVSLLATSAGFASAAGINLGWLDCPSGPTYTLSRTFACATNTGGGHALIATFVADTGLVAVTGYAGVVDIQTSGAGTYAPWWQLRTGGCRTAAAAAHSADFTGGPFTCVDYWQAGAVGGYSIPDPPVGNRARIKMQAALPSQDSRITAIPEGTEVYTWKLTLNNSKTVGLGACAGCTDEVCIVYNSVLVTQAPGTVGHGNQLYSSPAVSQHVFWQGWSTTDPAHLCPAVTPTRNRTWGSIKAIYR
jgi:hypothetical protein